MNMTPKNSPAPDMPASMQKARIYVDHTHLGRHVTGIERITKELFSPRALAPLEIVPVKSTGLLSMMAAQNITLPLKARRNPGALVLCPGFPPSMMLSAFGGRVIPYIHDMFLLQRPQDLSLKARAYMVQPFRRAVKKLPVFMVNSEYTRTSLRKFCRPDAQIMLYRPAVRNVFSLKSRPRDKQETGELRLVALGTVEPRKNLATAAAIIAALRQNGFANARLDILGRFGWGDDTKKLQGSPGVHLHGYQPLESIRDYMHRADLFINTSHDEGLGLPLLEAQYAGLPVVAPQGEVFREVLGRSGLLIPPGDPRAGADMIKALVSAPDWRKRSAWQAAENLKRWNMAATDDRAAIVNWLLRRQAG